VTRYIVHESGVIFDASECVLINDENLDDHDMARLSGDDYYDDSVMDEIAQRLGIPIPDAVDAARWDAFVNSPDAQGSTLRAALTYFRCASCESAGVHPVPTVWPLAALVVPWDVMGDARSFAFVCDGCGNGSSVVVV
jgi:hypothetical protein